MNIDLKDFDRTKHICLNGWIDRPSDLLLIEQVGDTVEAGNHEQNYSQSWRVAYRGTSFDRAEVENIVRDHFYHFQECGRYQRASVDGDSITVLGGLDV